MCVEVVCYLNISVYWPQTMSTLRLALQRIYMQQSTERLLIFASPSRNCWDYDVLIEVICDAKQGVVSSAII